MISMTTSTFFTTFVVLTLVPIPLLNSHTMVTRSKNGISKPRLFFAEHIDIEPPSMKRP